MTPSIPEQAVEAAALTLYALQPETNMGEPIRWRDLADHLAALYRSRARAALTAAAPLLGTVGRDSLAKTICSDPRCGSGICHSCFSAADRVLSLRPALPAPAGWQEIAHRLRKHAEQYQHDADFGYAYDTVFKDGSHANPSAEAARKTALLLNEAADALSAPAPAEPKEG